MAGCPHGGPAAPRRLDGGFVGHRRTGRTRAGSDRGPRIGAPSSRNRNRAPLGAAPLSGATASQIGCSSAWPDLAVPCGSQSGSGESQSAASRSRHPFLGAAAEHQGAGRPPPVYGRATAPALPPRRYGSDGRSRPQPLMPTAGWRKAPERMGSKGLSGLWRGPGGRAPCFLWSVWSWQSTLVVLGHQAVEQADAERGGALRHQRGVLAGSRPCRRCRYAPMACPLTKRWMNCAAVMAPPVGLRHSSCRRCPNCDQLVVCLPQRHAPDSSRRWPRP